MDVVAEGPDRVGVERLFSVQEAEKGIGGSWLVTWVPSTVRVMGRPVVGQRDSISAVTPSSSGRKSVSHAHQAYRLCLFTIRRWGMGPIERPQKPIMRC